MEPRKPKKYKIPKKIHYVWVGGPIPENYFQTKLEMGSIAKQCGEDNPRNKYTVHVWVDNKDNFYKALAKTSHNYQQLNIKVREISELQDKLLNHHSPDAKRIAKTKKSLLKFHEAHINQYEKNQADAQAAIKKERQSAKPDDARMQKLEEFIAQHKMLILRENDLYKELIKQLRK